MMSRAFLVLLAAAIPGLLFAPVFGLWALVPPVAAVVVACYAAFGLTVRFPALVPWRPVLGLVVGLLALVEVSLFDTTRGGLPTADSVRALAAGVTDSWQLTLQSTWPVRPEAELLLFVPLLVLCTALVGLELLRWPAVAALPGVTLLLLSQAFVAVSGLVATLVALAYAVVVAGLYFSRARSAVVLTVALSVVAGLAATAIDPGPAYSVRQHQAAQVQLPRTVSPLDEVAARLVDPDTPVFSYTSDTPVDRWRLVVLDEFDGAKWTTNDSYRRLGAEIGPQSGVTVPTAARSARVTVPAGDDPWLPSQIMPASVTGIAPLIDQDTGVLSLQQRDSAKTYELRWWEPDGDLAGLGHAGVSSEVVPGGLGAIPAGVAELAHAAVGDARPTFRTALALERYLSGNYHVVKGKDLPTGSGWPQLREFLLETKSGTSEQFAAAYVVLARILGIPARLAVGYRAPRDTGGKVVVRNRDVLAWPEVAVDGVGWVPLDPVGAASDTGSAPSPLAESMARAREDLPPPNEKLADPPVAEMPDAAAETGIGLDVWALARWVVAVLLALLVLAVLAVPAAKLMRTLRRKRFTGVRGVVGAWWEARDLLRSHGSPVSPGMTARDLAAVSEGSVVDSLHRLAVHLDTALWSGEGATDSTVAGAWAAVREIRAALAGRSRTARLRAVFAIR